MNTCILFVPGLLAVVYPQVQTLAALLGAVGGMLVIYFLPTFTYLKQSHMAIKDPALVEAIRSNQYSFDEN